jgi:hypothetical protein
MDIDLLKPNTAERVEHKQQQQKAQHDSCGKSRTFRTADTVLITGPGWLPGKNIWSGVIQVLLDDGRCKRCHQDQLRPRVTDDGPPDMSEIPVTPTTPETGPGPEITNSDQPNVRTNPITTLNTTESSDTSDSTDTTNSSDSNIRRCPRRQRKPRERFDVCRVPIH